MDNGHKVWSDKQKALTNRKIEKQMKQKADTIQQTSKLTKTGTRSYIKEQTNSQMNRHEMNK